MHLLRAIVILLVLLPSAGFAAAASPEVRAAIGPGLHFMVERTLAWKAERGCATCHHAPMMLWVANAARARGHTVDEDAVRVVRDWIQSPDNAANFFPADLKPDRTNGSSLATTFVLNALAAGPADQIVPAAVQQITEYLAGVQEPDGSWLLRSNQGRPPIFHGATTTTRLVRYALAQFPEHAASSIAAADTWLAAQTAVPTQQERVLDLLLAKALARPQEEIDRNAAALLSLQNADGSWSQDPAMAGDAFATGQALYALRNAHAASETVSNLATGFLLRTQHADGSWPMVSRPSQGSADPPITGTEPIVTAATGWALLGLLSLE